MKIAFSATLLVLAGMTVTVAQDVATQKPQVEPSISAKAQPKPAEPAKKKTPTKSNLNLNLTAAPKANWIWGPSDNVNYTFHKTLTIESVQSAALIASCDNAMEVIINGKRLGGSQSWETATRINLTKALKPGKNSIVIQGKNQGGPAGLAAKVVWLDKNRKRHAVVTDKSWLLSDDAKKEPTISPRVIAGMGGGPWGNVFANVRRGGNLPSTPRGVFNVLPGYQVELLYTVPKGQQGSWVSFCFDNKGRIIASDQGNKGLYRITLPKTGSDEVTKVEKLKVPMTSAQGMVYAFNSLYVSANGGPGSGLYRLRDTTGDDQYDKVEKLKAFAGGGEHGPHAVRLSPDGKSLYVIAGNHTNLPAGVNHSRVPSNWSEDHLLPRRWDARGHARGKLAPGGWICRTDPDGKKWEVVSIGYRNPYDMDFNVNGELFAYDADMEWDMGTPWYRPTRVVHATSGSEFGWRSGTGKWPTYYVDSLPQAVDIGPGSPTGASFGTGAKFPAKYQRALFIVDWTFGTMYAVHLTPKGSSYTAVREEFVSRTPLPLTDVEIGPDGAMYFTVGGRGTQSALYRVTYTGKESTAPATRDESLAEQRKARQKLEELHRKSANGEKAVDAIWGYLSHKDRHIRYAARVALEHQDPKFWESRALTETDPQALISAAVALTRQGDKSLRNDLLNELEKIDFGALGKTQQLELLRTYALVFIRMGRPDGSTAAKIARRLEKHYPAKSNSLNSELCRVLVYLNSPQVVSKTIALLKKPSEVKASKPTELLARNQGYGRTIAQMLANQADLQKLHYAFVLRNVRFGWTLEERRQYHEWLNDAQTKSGGASYQGFIKNIRDDSLANTSAAERKALAETTIKAPPKPSELPKPKGPGRKWIVSDLVEATTSGLRGRDFNNGRRAFAAAKCSSCHRYLGEGGSTGPDLTNVAGRFSLKDLSESLILPSKVISDQYQSHKIRTEGGKIYTGRVLNKTDKSITVLTDPFDGTKVVEIAVDDLAQMAISRISLMPGDLLNTLNRDEVLDLLAYLMSRGNPDDTMFK